MFNNRLSRGDSQICSVCWFLWYQYSQNNQFQTTTQHQWMRELERDEKLACRPALQNTTGCKGHKNIFSHGDNTLFPKLFLKVFFTVKDNVIDYWLGHGNKLGFWATFITHMIISGQQSCAEKSTAGMSATHWQACLQGRPVVASGNAGSERVPTTPIDKHSLLCQNYLCQQYSLFWIPALLLEVWNVGSWQAEGALCDQLPVKTMGT